MKKVIISAQLKPIPLVIYMELNKVKPYGWISELINNAIMEKYGKNFEEKVLTELLNDKQRQRDKLEKEMDMIQKKLMKVKRK